MQNRLLHTQCQQQLALQQHTCSIHNHRRLRSSRRWRQTQRLSEQYYRTCPSIASHAGDAADDCWQQPSTSQPEDADRVNTSQSASVSPQVWCMRPLLVLHWVSCRGTSSTSHSNPALACPVPCICQLQRDCCAGASVEAGCLSCLHYRTGTDVVVPFSRINCKPSVCSQI